MPQTRSGKNDEGGGDDQRTTRCTLCGTESQFFQKDSARRYFRCPCCRLVFVDPRDLPSRENEYAHYQLHQNDPRDRRYRDFLNRLFEPMNARLTARSRGLDFGSCPGPALSLMFTEAGHTMQIYDPFYAPDPSVLQGLYDFITASEVAEHFHQPGEEFARLWSLLHPHGWLGIMTKRLRDADSFGTWHYKLDPTHVSFFSLETFHWLALRLQAECVVAGNDVVLFRRTWRAEVTAGHRLSEDPGRCPANESAASEAVLWGA